MTTASIPATDDELSTLALCARIDALTAELHDALAQFRLEQTTPASDTLAPVTTPSRQAA